jgi:hypothetical protein
MNLTPEQKNICPCCGYDGLADPYEPESYDICPQCGVEFGYEMVENYPAIKVAWMAAGSPSWSQTYEQREMWAKIHTAEEQP